MEGSTDEDAADAGNATITLPTSQTSTSSALSRRPQGLQHPSLYHSGPDIGGAPHEHALLPHECRARTRTRQSREAPRKRRRAGNFILDSSGGGPPRLLRARCCARSTAPVAATRNLRSRRRFATLRLTAGLGKKILPPMGCFYIDLDTPNFAPEVAGRTSMLRFHAMLRIAGKQSGRSTQTAAESGSCGVNNEDGQGTPTAHT